METLLGMRSSAAEKSHLFTAWILVSIAFAIAYNIGNGIGFLFTQHFTYSIIVFAITVGIGFLLHELAHKYVAQKYGCWAEFRSDFAMLALAIGMSFFGFVFAAPGAVFISGRVTKEKNGKIAAAGPITNIALALLFLLFLIPSMSSAVDSAIFGIGRMGYLVNSWFAVFNMIPVWQFDGAKVWRWSKMAYAAILGIGLVLMFTQSFFFA